VSPRIRELAGRLASHEPEVPPTPKDTRHAAVALCLRESQSLEILFIRRADDPRDPWSGHMAFPGGRVEPWDNSPFHAAVRETREEVDVPLREDKLIGNLSPIRAPHRGKRAPLLVHPYVFNVPGATRTRPDAREVQETLWIPLSFFLHDAKREEMTWQYGGQTFELPSYDYDGRRIWGLTLRMLDELLAILT
jgi:8-oxo-dGTP pyrophosphatase MutT (NUDIX family)